MLAIWWDSKAVLLFELLPPDSSINLRLFSQQLDRLTGQSQRKRSIHLSIRFLRDNARAHVAEITWRNLVALDWEVPIHPPDSPNPLHYQYPLLFSLSKSFLYKSLSNENVRQQWLKKFFGSKSKTFYGDFIQNMLEK